MNFEFCNVKCVLNYCCQLLSIVIFIMSKVFINFFFGW